MKVTSSAAVSTGGVINTICKSKKHTATVNKISMASYCKLKDIYENRLGAATVDISDTKSDKVGCDNVINDKTSVVNRSI